MFQAIVPTVFIKRLRRLAQCSGSETLKCFFLVRFSLRQRKMNNNYIVAIIHSFWNMYEFGKIRLQSFSLQFLAFMIY